MSRIDLDNPPPRQSYKLSLEREETRGERFVRLTKDLALFATALGFVVVVAWICVTTAINESATAEERKWATSILTAAMGGLLGWLVKR